MLKTITNPSTGLTFKMGRKRPVARYPRLSLKNYLMLTMPAPPSSTDYTAAAAKQLANIYLNDTLGDCVIAGMAHVEGVLRGNSGAELGFSNEEIIALYSAIGGYVPGNPSTDNGCDEQTALNYWQQSGLLVKKPKHKCTGWLAVNPSDRNEVRVAMWLFENLVFGLELPDAWVNPAPSGSGFTWNVEGPADPNNGHCFVGVGYTPAGVLIDTWGMIGTVLNAAVAQYAGASDGGELYTVLSQDSISRATLKAPNGFAWSQLLADFEAIKV
jgi:hypothetical protein